MVDTLATSQREFGGLLDWAYAGKASRSFRDKNWEAVVHLVPWEQLLEGVGRRARGAKVLSGIADGADEACPTSVAAVPVQGGLTCGCREQCVPHLRAQPSATHNLVASPVAQQTAKGAEMPTHWIGESELVLV